MPDKNPDAYVPKAYWESRLSAAMNLEGVGCLGRGLQYNSAIYRAKMRTFMRGARRLGLGEAMRENVLDLGTGIGFWIEFFVNHGAKHCVGVDITEAAVSQLKRRFPAERTAFVCSDLADPELPSRVGGRSSLVTAFDVLYHIVDDAALERAIANVGKLTEDNGWFVFSDAVHRKDQGSKESHVRWRSLREWSAILERSGFVIRAHLPMYVFLHPALSGPGPLRPLVRFVHYRVTPRLSERGPLGRGYLGGLNRLDSLLTRFTGTSHYLVFAQKQAAR